MVFSFSESVSVKVCDLNFQSRRAFYIYPFLSIVFISVLFCFVFLVFFFLPFDSHFNFRGLDASFFLVAIVPGEFSCPLSFPTLQQIQPSFTSKTVATVQISELDLCLGECRKTFQEEQLLGGRVEAWILTTSMFFVNIF